MPFESRFRHLTNAHKLRGFARIGGNWSHFWHHCHQISGGIFMARINIEEQFWDDVASVAAKMGDVDKAAGQALRLIRYGQQRYTQSRRISYAEFKEKFSDALIPEFARRCGDEIEVAGASKYFDWLDQKRQAGKKGGKASARRPRDSKGRLTPSKQNPSTSKRTPSETKLSQASSSISSSSSSSSETPIVPLKGDVEFLGDFKKAWELYRTKFPNVTKGPKAEERFKKQIRSPETEHQLLAAIENYSRYLKLPDNDWRRPKTSFETFLGTTRSGEFWTEYVVWQLAWGSPKDSTDWDYVFGKKGAPA